MTENKELVPVLECRQPAVIVENLTDLHDRVAAVRETVNALPRSRDSLPEVKKARAELRKYFASLETQRKLVKAEVMAPYDKAEKAYKELVARPIDEADALCKAFVEDVENDVKRECEDSLRAYFTELCQAKGIHWLPFERAGVRVTMALADQKEPRRAKEQIFGFVQRVDQDLAAISGMEDSAEILVEYEQTLDVATAISRVNSRKQAKAIMEENRARHQEVQNANAQAVQRIAARQEEMVRVVQQEKKFRAAFEVLDTLPRIRGLKAFLEGNHYDYQEVTKDGKQ